MVCIRQYKFIFCPFCHRLYLQNLRSMALSVCVVGAGVCGLVAIKACLEEGLNVDCYDKMDDIGGLWRYREQDLYGVPSVMKNTIIDTSKEMSAFSDFPPDAECANFMHNTSVIQYFEKYADHFKLRPHIHLEHEIMRIEPSKNYDNDGSWLVKIKNKKGEIKERNYNAVMIGTGHHTYPQMPNFPGLDSFEGKIIHTHSYKDHRNFEDKKILVVGIGNSGVDTSVELARVGKQVYLSTRRGCWITPRVGNNGIPWDLIYVTRFFTYFFSKIVPPAITNSFFENKISKRMDHELYGLKPEHRFLNQHVTVGDDLPNAILSGRVKVCSDVDHFTKTGVVFKDHEKHYEIDAVVLATGFNFQLPFLDKRILDVKENKTHLYKFVFPPHLKHPTLAVIGFIQPRGSIFPLAEIQSRWATMVFGKKIHLPSTQDMSEDVLRRQQAIQRQFIQTPRHTVECHYVHYFNEIASLIGARPQLWSMLFTDPQLFFACIFGPCVPYQFRLQGPHPWCGARDAILKVGERVRYPLTKRKVTKSKSQLMMFTPFIFLILVIIFYYWF